MPHKRRELGKGGQQLLSAEDLVNWSLQGSRLVPGQELPPTARAFYGFAPEQEWGFRDPALCSLGCRDFGRETPRRARGRDLGRLVGGEFEVLLELS